MSKSKDIKPILILSYVLIGSGIIGVYMFFNLLHDPSFDSSFSIFIAALTAWHLLTGIGIIFRGMWGFRLLKFYLYILYAGIPIGTFIAVRFLKYIKEKNIEEAFRKS